MSVFFGIFNPKGNGVDLEAFDQMKKAADRPGHNGIGTYVDNHIALGHIMLKVTPESQFDQQPLKSSCGKYILIGHFRLDYRDELGDKLGLRQSELRKTPDSNLAMMAYEKWRENCVCHLEGDWAFLIYDICSNKIMMSKDSSGVSALFYFKHNDRLYFGSDSAYILSITSLMFEINPDEFEKMSIPGRYFIEGHSIIKDLDYLLAQEMLLVSSEFKLVKKRYLTSLREDICYSNEEDYIQDFLYLFFKAVDSRILKSESNGIFLSGGLDSTSTAALSSILLNDHKNGLIAFTSIPQENFELPESDTVMFDESSLVKQMQLLYPNLQLNFNSFPEANVSADIEMFINKNAFHPVLTKNSYWISGFLGLGVKSGLKNFLTGQSGNYTITWNGSNYYLDLLFNFKSRKLFSVIIAERKRAISLYTVIKVILLVPGLIFFKDFVGKVLKGNFQIRNPYISLRKEFGYYFLKGITYRIKYLFNMFLDFSSLKVMLQRNVFSFTSIWWYLLSSKNNTQISDPTSDKRLVQFLNSVPQDLFFKGLTRKYLFKRTFKGFLPLEVLENPKKQLQSGDFEYRFSKYFENVSIEGNRGSCVKSANFNTQFMDRTRKILENDPGRLHSNIQVNNYLIAFSLQKFCLSEEKFNFANNLSANEPKNHMVKTNSC